MVEAGESEVHVHGYGVVAGGNGREGLGSWNGMWID